MKTGLCVGVGLIPLLAAAAALPAIGDVVTLRNGSRFEGQVTETDGRVQIRMDSGTMTFPSESVASIERKSSPMDVFSERRAALDEGDAEGHYALACWARKEGLNSAAREEFQTVIAIVPGHAGAREALGYRLVDGHWLTEAEWHAARGEVKGADGWVAAKTEAAAEETSVEVQALREEVRRLREELAALTEQSRAALAVAEAENRRLQAENLNLAASSSAYAGLVIRLQSELAPRAGCSPFGLQAPIDIADPRWQTIITRMAESAPCGACAHSEPCSGAGK